MRNLIKKILFEEFYSRKFYIEEITLDEFNLLLEDDFEHKEKEATVEVDKKKEAEVDLAIANLYNMTNNKGQGYFYDTNSKRSFWIETSTHWLQRLDRKNEKEYENDDRYYNPTNKEGIDIIYNLKDKIFDKLRNHNWTNSSNMCLKLIDYNNGIFYTNIVRIYIGSSRCEIGKQCYRIKLITNLKGPKFATYGTYNDCRHNVK